MSNFQAFSEKSEKPVRDFDLHKKSVVKDTMLCESQARNHSLLSNSNECPYCTIFILDGQFLDILSTLIYVHENLACVSGTYRVNRPTVKVMGQHIVFRSWLIITKI